MGLKPGYKQTEIGVIPEEWPVKSLASVCDVRDGTHESPRFYEEGIPFVTSKNIVDGHLDLNGVSFISEQDAADFNKRSRVDRNDILMSMIGTIGNAVLVDFEPGFCIKNVALIKPQAVDSRYLVQLINSPPFQKYLANNLDGGIQKFIALGSLRELAVPTPSPFEQHAIAEALSDMDALIGGLDKLIAKKRDIKQAAMQQLLTGKQRLQGFGGRRRVKQRPLGAVPEDWDLKRLGAISTMSGRIGWQGLKQSEFTQDADDPFLITGMNFKDGKIRWQEVYHIPTSRYEEATNIQLRGDDVLMTKDGTIGKLLYVDEIPYPGKASLNSHLLVFRPLAGAYVPKFLFYQLSSKVFLEYVDLNKSGSTFYGITQEAVSNYKAYLPAIPEQTAIANALSDMDADIGALEKKRDKTRALKQGMMQELLTGRTRLV
jgi:type I restriction enzyme S subunit